MQDSQTRIGVVVVNWNRAFDTVAAYKSLQSSTVESWRLYVVDNASVDNSVEILRRELGEKSTLILNDSNSGFAGGCNVGVRRALAEGASHIFLLNNDATVLPSTLEHLVSASTELADDAVLGSAIKIDGTDRFQFFGSRTQAAYGHPIWFDDEDKDKLGAKLIDTDFVLGAALFAPAKIWRDVGFFDEKFYLNFEETDWCYRARRRGYTCYVVSGALTLHSVGATVGPTDGPLQKYFLCRNELLFAANHATLRQKANVLARTVTILLKSIVKDLGALRPFRPSTKAHAAALYDFARGKFGDCPPLIRKFAKDHAAA